MLCQSDNDCSDNTCQSDNDCKDSKLCSFDKDKLEHYCIDNNIHKLYVGCLDDNIIENSIESKSLLDKQNYKNCIDFSRRQINNNNGLEYNFMIFKPQKEFFVDTSDIHIYLKCNNKIVVSIPYEDYFILHCDKNKKKCLLESKDTLFNFIKKNSFHCLNDNDNNNKNNSLQLEIHYQCENENIKKIELISLSSLKKNIKISLKCPIDNNTSQQSKSKCNALYLEDDIQVNSKKNSLECLNPLYKVPIITKNIHNYKKLKGEMTTNELKDYDEKINKKMDEIKKLEAEKYMKLKKIQTNKDISFEEAYTFINQLSINKLLKNSNEKWKIHENYDVLQKINLKNNNDSIKYYGLVFTIQDAIKIANEKNENFFVWYHNTYELKNYASKLYFIDIYNIQDELFNKKNWSKNNNVSTCILNFNLEKFIDNTNDNDEIDSEENILFHTILGTLQEQTNKDKELKNTYFSILNNINDKNVNYKIIHQLNDKITTYNQIISMNNYETNINNQILVILGFILMIVIFIFILQFIYYYYYHT